MQILWCRYYTATMSDGQQKSDKTKVSAKDFISWDGSWEFPESKECHASSCLNKFGQLETLNSRILCGTVIQSIEHDTIPANCILK